MYISFLENISLINCFQETFVSLIFEASIARDNSGVLILLATAKKIPITNSDGFSLPHITLHGRLQLCP